MQALGVVRFPLLAAALGYWVFRQGWVRDWVARLLRWSVVYIGVQCLWQFGFGHNLFGWSKGPAGELTGPYTKPRAGPVLSRILFPALLVWGRTRWRQLAAMVGAVALMMLVAQRMPLLLVFFGLGADRVAGAAVPDGGDRGGGGGGGVAGGAAGGVAECFAAGADAVFPSR